jgi:uncharacterized membrane protein YsdA (DUF1294 family)
VDLIILVVLLSLLGFVIYVVTERIAMDADWRTTIRLFALVVLVIYLVSKFVAIPNVLR